MSDMLNDLWVFMMKGGVFLGGYAIDGSIQGWLTTLHTILNIMMGLDSFIRGKRNGTFSEGSQNNALPLIDDNLSVLRKYVAELEGIFWALIVTQAELLFEVQRSTSAS